MAFVVPRQGTEAGEGEVIEWARDRMANYKAPRRVAFVEELPINATGKVVKTELRALADLLDTTDAPDGGITNER
jgi:acyl-coenzyme A synthetase/AMP-(fatty) acid ligase